MSFSGEGSAYADNNKQHLNLSMLAYDIIQRDKITFNGKNDSGVINRIFEYFAPVAEASISQSKNLLKERLIQLFSEVEGDEKTKAQLIEKMLQDKENEILKEVQAYEKGKQLKFWLNQKNLRYLTEPESECCKEGFYKDHRGKYIKCVLEEYARLPYVQRERIYYTPFIEEIEYALREKCQLRAKTGNNFVFSVFPYEISCDPLSTANYLVGFSRPYSHPEADIVPCSFRISALSSIKAEKSKSAFLKDERRKELVQAIAFRGVQFMTSDKTEVVCVKLTQEGKVKYQRQVHMRPTLVESKGDIFKFSCTEIQAGFYFFKFGADAEIIEPKSLREKFKAMYECALLKYGSD